MRTRIDAIVYFLPLNPVMFRPESRIIFLYRGMRKMFKSDSKILRWTYFVRRMFPKK